MKMFLKRLSLVLAITIVFTSIVFSYNVSATPLLEGPSVGGLNWFDWTCEALKGVGFIVDTTRLHPTPLEMAQAINSNDPNANVQDSDESINNYITENITVNNNDNSITYNNKTKYILDYVSNLYIQDCGYKFLYPYNLGLSQSTFPTQAMYNKIEQIIRVNTRPDNYYYCTVGRKSGSNDYWILLIKATDNVVGLIKGGNPLGNDSQAIDFYDLDTWEKLQLDSNNSIYYEWDNGIEEFSSTILPFTTKDSTFSYLENQKRTNNNYYYYINAFSNNGYGVIQMFTNINDLRNFSGGIMPYYINTPIWSSYKNSSGDYTVNSNNRNNISYGDVTNYVNNYYGEHGEYPSSPVINIYIDENIPNTDPNPTPTPNNPSGSTSNNSVGGSASATATANNSGVNVTVNNNHQITIGWPWSVSGNSSGNNSDSNSGGTVSGNGSSGGGIGNIFDFLGYIGDLIGDLISGIGRAFVGILEGVSTAVQVVVEGIPNVLSPLIGFIFEGLPEEITSLMTLGISAVLLIAIVKAIRK